MKGSTALLRKRLVASLLVAGLLPFASSAWIAQRATENDADKAARDHIEAETLGAAAAINAAVGQAYDQARALARDRRVQTALVLNDTYTLGAMSAAGATIATGTKVPSSPQSVSVAVRAGNKIVGHVSVELASPETILRRAATAAGPAAALAIKRGDTVIASDGAPMPESPTTGSVRERPLSVFGPGARLVVVDTAPPAYVASVRNRLLATAGLSIMAIGLLAFWLAKPLLKGIGVVEKAAAEADYDPLTGLSNRRAFGRTLDLEMVRSQRTGRPCALVLLDLDDFKLLNDAHGHAVGDEALCLVADVLREQVRAIDLAARLGGEELAVLLPETASEQAMVVAERLRVAIEQLEIPGADGSVVQISGSLGVADTGSAADADTFLKQADEALYAAKRAGKNRVVSAPERAATAA